MRPLFVLSLLLVVAGCADTPMGKLRAACEAGDLNACQAVQQNQMIAIQSLQQGIANVNARHQPPAMQQTVCTPMNAYGGVHCTTY